MPHLLIAGSTGTGKSVAINCYHRTLLLQHTPDELKFIMIDPKMVEMIVYNQIPHLLAPVVTELERVVSLLKWAVREMERRYKLLAPSTAFATSTRYNKAARRRADLEPLPYIVIIIDELADLMMMAPDEVETLICRLAQMARAIGIHLILATQRPSVDVVTGLIKANFPSRIAFAVTSADRLARDPGHERRRAAARARRHALPGLRRAQADPRAGHLRLRARDRAHRQLLARGPETGADSEASVPLRPAGTENKPTAPAQGALSTGRSRRCRPRASVP